MSDDFETVIKGANQAKEIDKRAELAINTLDSHDTEVDEKQLARLAVIVAYHIREDYEDNEALQEATDIFIGELGKHFNRGD